MNSSLLFSAARVNCLCRYLSTIRPYDGFEDSGADNGCGAERDGFAGIRLIA
jgi:hypothetical protein